MLHKSFTDFRNCLLCIPLYNLSSTILFSNCLPDYHGGNYDTWALPTNTSSIKRKLYAPRCISIIVAYDPSYAAHMLWTVVVHLEEHSWKQNFGQSSFWKSKAFTFVLPMLNDDYTLHTIKDSTKLYPLSITQIHIVSVAQVVPCKKVSSYVFCDLHGNIFSFFARQGYGYQLGQI